MSEFTDFHALLTEAETLGVLRAGLIERVGGADVPLDELGVDFTLGFDVLEKAWAGKAKPVWIKLGIAGALDDLGKLGPAVRIQVEEDFSSWSLEARCGGAAFNAAFLLEEGIYRGVTDDSPVYTPEAGMADVEAIAPCIGLTPQEMKDTLVADGGESFSAATGILYEQMLDMTLDEIEPGQVTFSFIY